jgi:hypothetical protein
MKYFFRIDEALQGSILSWPFTSIPGTEAAVKGAIAGLAAQIFTTPLDVARTRIMLQSSVNIGDKYEGNTLLMMTKIVEQEGISALAAGVKPRSLRAIASGAIQFAAIEGSIKAIFKSS